MSDNDLCCTMAIDLGKTRNHTAMVVLERRYQAATVADFIASGTRGFGGEFRYTVVKAERLALGTPFPAVVEWVKRSAQEFGETLRTIVVDASGLGSVVMDELRRAQIGVSLVGVVSTGEQSMPGGGRTAGGFRTVARAELLMKLQVAVQGERFEVDVPRCREWEVLRRELTEVRLEGGRRKGGKVQDDLAMALALAVWWGMQRSGG